MVEEKKIEEEEMLKITEEGDVSKSIDVAKLHGKDRGHLFSFKI